MIESNKISGFLCATSITTIYYLISKSVDKLKADDIIDKLLQLFNIADVNKNILIKSLENNGKDFEDSVIYTSAEYFNIDIIITRDKKGFQQSNIKVMKPSDFLKDYQVIDSKNNYTDYENEILEDLKDLKSSMSESGIKTNKYIEINDI